MGAKQLFWCAANVIKAHQDEFTFFRDLVDLKRIIWTDVSTLTKYKRTKRAYYERRIFYVNY